MKTFTFVTFALAALAGCNKQPLSSPVPTLPKVGVNHAEVKQGFAFRWVQFSPNNKRLLVSMRREKNSVVSGLLVVWDVASRRRIAVWETPDPVDASVFLRNGNVLLAGYSGIQMRDWSSGRLIRNLPGPLSPRIMEISSDKKTIFILGEGNIEVRNIVGWKLLRRIKIDQGVSGFAKHLSVSHDGSKIIATAWDIQNGITAYSVGSGQELWKVECDGQGNAAWSPNGRLVAANTTDGLLLLRASNGQIIRRINHDYRGSVKFLSNHKLRYSSEKRSVIYDIQTGKWVKYPRPKGLDENEALSLDESILARVARDGSKVEFAKNEQKR